MNIDEANAALARAKADLKAARAKERKAAKARLRAAKTLERWRDKHLGVLTMNESASLDSLISSIRPANEDATA